MVRKRILISVENADATQFKGRQIGFSLIPTEWPSAELYKTVFPVLWQVFPLDSTPQIEIAYDLVWSVSLIAKADRASGELFTKVDAGAGRVVPPNHLAELTYSEGLGVMWGSVIRSLHDIPSSIEVMNSSRAPVPFAICLAHIPENEHNAEYIPVLHFDSISRAERIRLKTTFYIKAFIGKGLQKSQQVNEKHMIPIADGVNPTENWKEVLERLPVDHDLVLRVTPTGAVVMERPGAVSSSLVESHANSIQEIQKVRQDLHDLRVHSDNVIDRVDNDINELRLKVDEVTRRADSLHTSAHGNILAMDDRSPESISGQVKEATNRLIACAELISVKLDWGQSLKEHMQELREGVEAVDRLLDTRVQELVNGSEEPTPIHLTPEDPPNRPRSTRGKAMSSSAVKPSGATTHTGTSSVANAPSGADKPQDTGKPYTPSSVGMSGNLEHQRSTSGTRESYSVNTLVESSRTASYRRARDRSRPGSSPQQQLTPIHAEKVIAPPLRIVTRPQGLVDEEETTIEEVDPMHLCDRRSRDESRHRAENRDVNVRRGKWRFLGIGRIWNRAAPGRPVPSSNR